MPRNSRSTTLFDNTTDADFRSWGSFIDAGILAGGYTHTADTGQIDFTTVLAPVAGNTSQGYKIYQSQDAGAGQNNYYLKLEFGSAASATRPAIWATYGWQTDGAGNLVSTTYPISSRVQTGTALNPAGTTLLVISADSTTNGKGYICFCANQSAASLSFEFSVERTRNSDLTFKDQLLIIQNILGGNIGSSTQVLDRNNAYPVFNAASQSMIVCPTANTPVAGIAALGLIFGLAPSLTSPSMCWLGTETNAIGRVQDVVQVPILAVNHSYIIIDGTNFVFSSAGNSPMMRYE